ncbi:hypothetical protein CAL65_05895 [Alkalilimnicola ehrlichii]|uniref:Uncharacterized protein n=1 Tax=Alkalilimnicola ehrlichii TaxID=351052 RepID=A0A3E0X2E3_9GAMM|nr:hypothetical protein CAL65_05895 [Alkalilimnicola ehrlichii]
MTWPGRFSRQGPSTKGVIRDVPCIGENRASRRFHIADRLCPVSGCQGTGLFAAEGLDVTLCRETSWANIRDKVMLGALDAAQMPAPMPLAATLGVAGPRVPMITPCVLNLGGNAITVSHDLFRQMLALAPEALREPPYTADALRAVIEARRILDKPPLVFATVFPTSTHYYQLCYWLSAAGIDPLRDLTLKVISPPIWCGRWKWTRLPGSASASPGTAWRLIWGWASV